MPNSAYLNLLRINLHLAKFSLSEITAFWTLCLIYKVITCKWVGNIGILSLCGLQLSTLFPLATEERMWGFTVSLWLLGMIWTVADIKKEMWKKRAKKTEFIFAVFRGFVDERNFTDQIIYFRGSNNFHIKKKGNKEYFEWLSFFFGLEILQRIQMILLNTEAKTIFSFSVKYFSNDKSLQNLQIFKFWKFHENLFSRTSIFWEFRGN